MDKLKISRMDSEQLSAKTKLALIDIIRLNGRDGRPFKLPNEDELSQRLGVSRNVLRDALMSLDEMGVVTRRRSKGTIANPRIASATCRLDINPELFPLIQDAGYAARMESVRLGFIFEPEPALKGAEFYLNSEKLFYADDVPAAYCADHISGQYANISNEVAMALKNLSHHRFIERYCNSSIAYTMSHLDAILPPPWLAEQLRIASTDPVLTLDDYIYSYDHALVAHSMIYFRRGILDLKFLRKHW